MAVLMHVILLLLVLGGVLTLALGQAGGVSSQEATPTPFVRQSLFSNDTCAPPCWYGLIPGESTSQEAELVLQTAIDVGRAEPYDFAEGEFDLDTEQLINGRFNFILYPWHRPDSTGLQPSQIMIADSAVDIINVAINEYVTVQETIDILGMPDRVTFLAGLSYYEIKFIYLESRLRVLHTSGGLTSLEGCNVIDVGIEFWIDRVAYYSPTAMVAPYYTDVGNFEVPQPAFLAYILDERDISLDTLESWLNAEVDETCTNVWHDLVTTSPDPILPTVMPTMTPTP